MHSPFNGFLNRLECRRVHGPAWSVDAVSVIFGTPNWADLDPNGVVSKWMGMGTW